MTTFPEPAWLNDIPDAAHRAAAKRRFLFRLAALYATENGMLVDLSEKIGRSRGHLHVMVNKGDPGYEACRAIEDLLGANLFPMSALVAR